MPIMLSNEHGQETTELQAAFARYRAAQTALRGLRKPSLAEVEAALQARVELFRVLVSTGWQPPEPLVRQIDLDAALVDQPHGALGG
jgi:hypothetical protein